MGPNDRQPAYTPAQLGSDISHGAANVVAAAANLPMDIYKLGGYAGNLAGRATGLLNDRQFLANDKHFDQVQNPLLSKQYNNFLQERREDSPAINLGLEAAMGGGAASLGRRGAGVTLSKSNLGRNWHKYAPAFLGGTAAVAAEAAQDKSLNELN